jgi:endo-1,4-beta-xylanase
MKILPALSFLLLTPLLAMAGRAAETPLVVPVWADTAPGSEGKTGDEKVRVTSEGEHVVSSIHHPTLTIYLPPTGTATGAAVLICPGGGHRELWMDHEGYNVARWFAAHGIAGVILKYRLAREDGSTYRVDVHSLADAQRALRLVRSRAAEWGIDPARLGIIGFSAGGEVAALAGQHFDHGNAAAADPVDRQDGRPAFQGLIYPGNAKSIVPAKGAPPAFLACGYDDRPDISEELARVYLRFKQAGVPAELHIYAGAGHGFGLRAANTFPAGAWPDRFREWLDAGGFLRPKA